METYDRFLNGITLARFYDFKDKKYALQMKVNYFLDRLRSMFKYEGLPDTIPERMLELYLINNGACAVTKVNDKLYAFTGGFGGELDEYYRPTIYTIANPYLKYSANLVIREDTDAVLCGNDSTFTGLLPMLEMYCSALTENELSMWVADINSRIYQLITADNDNDYNAAKEYLKHVIDGDMSVIGQGAFFDGVRTQPYASEGANRLLTDLIEYEQYLKAGLFNDIGLNANYNMKRESINSSESQLNNDALTPLIDDMLNCRKDFCRRINEKYGTNIDVEFASAWLDNEKETAAELEALDPETNPETEPENVSRETAENESEGGENERTQETN